MFIKMRDIKESDKILTELPLILELGQKPGQFTSIHNVEYRQASNGEIYYIFKYRYGKAINNYNEQDYKKLKEELNIDNITIFQSAYDNLLEVSRDNN